MNKAQKLLYVLPDLAFSVELVPTKKPNTFSISDFHQVNGELIKDEQFVKANLAKLAEKIQPDDYQVVLPDFLFTNTIVNIEESSEAKVKEVLKKKTLPELGLNTKDYYLETFVLTKHKGIYKVQLSALEKSLVEPLKSSLSKSNLNITNIMPLSWTVKSVVSLEPSITVLQIGDFVYLAEQYIGMDQCNSAAVAEVDDLVETIKTLKGSESSIQTIYLLTSETVEKKLKAGIKDLLPMQQLAAEQEGEQEMPGYVKQITEAGAKTMSIPDYLMPKFSVGKPSVASKKKEEEAAEVPTPVVIDADEKPAEDLPKPTEPEKEGSESKVEGEEKPAEESKKDVMFGEDEPEKEGSESKVEGEEKPVEEASEVKTENKEEYKEVDLSQFAEGGDDKEDDKKTGLQEDKKVEESSEVKAEMKTEEKVEVKTEEKEVIKDKAGVNGMLKMFFIGLVSFFVTVGIGLALGLGYLKLSSNKQAEEAPTVEVVEEVEVTPTPAPEPVEINKEELSVLIVNATKIAGHASETAGLLDEAGYGSSKASNANGEYEAGVYLLLAEENQDLLKAVSEDTALDLVFSDDVKTEDPDGDYDLVIVLAE
jgi:hypothetical protein